MAQTRNENTEKNLTEWSTRADVNGDGVVNMQDVLAIIAIMQKAGGVSDGKTKYYWYVGQEAVTADNYTTLAESSSTNYTNKNYNTYKLAILSDGKLKCNTRFAEHFFKLCVNLIKISIFIMHFIYKNNSGDVSAVGKFPSLFSTYRHGRRNNYYSRINN